MGASKAEQTLLLLSFASQTSHFWQLGGVMQAKIRSLLRLLVKSIIWHRERQADATAAWEAYHSASSSSSSAAAADLSVQNTQDAGTFNAGTDTHAHSYINREIHGMLNLYQERESRICISTMGRICIFFFHPQTSPGNARKSEVKNSVMSWQAHANAS